MVCNGTPSGLRPVHAIPWHLLVPHCVRLSLIRVDRCRRAMAMIVRNSDAIGVVKMSPCAAPARRERIPSARETFLASNCCTDEVGDGRPMSLSADLWIFMLRQRLVLEIGQGGCWASERTRAPAARRWAGIPGHAELSFLHRFPNGILHCLLHGVFDRLPQDPRS